MLAGCEERLSTVHPAGPAASAIADLWWVLLIGSVAITLLVAGLVLWAWRRPEGAVSERRFVIWLGLAFPMTVLWALLAYGLFIGERLLPREGPDTLVVTAEARRYEWRFGYDDRPGAVTRNRLHIPAGRPVDVAITSVDVVHAFWVPRLAGKLDAVPGHVNTLRIEAAQPGEYAGLSAEYNGPGYRGHGFTVIAHDAAGWQAFLQGEAP
ncbi:cytochrome c oxidase subunit II [Paracoccus zeaxanthinifaciens]|uniref:cytochrome c oxidase subunit II n=1 Tax=Paracoccus zeaxanthinifaciens TaxID=187400 RepID=UPI0003B78DE3|nr:cytochrome b561 [Paracoccus zeaxanthinifaciens]